MAAQGSVEGTAGPEVLKVIDGQLADAQATAASLQARSTTIISSCGVLIALFLGLAALVTEADGFALPRSSAILLALAILFFAGTGVCTLLVASPVSTGMFDIASLKAISADNVLALPASKAYPEIAKAQIEVIRIARDRNTTLKKELFLAMVLGVSGILAAALGAVIALLAGGPAPG